MLDALKYLHWHEMCHRDLKLENWVYQDETADSRLKLIDFGYSKVFRHGTPMCAMTGTVYYVAPEILEGEGYSEKCDIWSTGVVLFMLLSGQAPFDGKSDEEIETRIFIGEVSFAGELWAKIGIGLNVGRLPY